MSDGTNTFAYDSAGHMTSDGVNSYTWDRASRLLSMGGSSYLYDGVGRRVQQTVSAQVTQYLLDTQPGLWQVLVATQGTNTTRYVHGPMGIQEQQNPDTTWRWSIPDGLGSVRGVVDSNVLQQEDRLYSPYGEAYQVSGMGQTAFGFTGEITDSNGLVQLRARYYNPTLGVFPNPDLLETPNRYTYVMGNMINMVDPSGLYSCKNELGGVPNACKDLHTALQRASNAGVSPAVLLPVELTATNETLHFLPLMLTSELLFGIQLTAYNTKDADNPTPLCSVIGLPDISHKENPAITSAKQSLVRLVTGILHITSAFQQFGNGWSLFYSGISRGQLRVQLNATGEVAYCGEGAGGLPGIEGCTPLHQDPPSRDMFLGGNISMNAMVHELGHVFDRNYNYAPSAPLRDLRLRLTTGDPFYNSQLGPGTKVPADADFTFAKGLQGRNSSETLQEEIWADTFMTIILQEQGIFASRNNKLIGWDCNQPVHANFKHAYAQMMLERLLQGGVAPSINEIAERVKADMKSGKAPCK